MPESIRKWREVWEWETDPDLNENFHIRHEVRVKDLIDLLSKEDPNAVVVIKDDLEILNYVVSRYKQMRYTGNNNIDNYPRKVREVSVVKLGSYI